MFVQFKARYDELGSDGRRLKHVLTYSSSRPRITAAWRQTNEPEDRVQSWEHATRRASSVSRVGC